jgi:multiple sugar transport system ATP-binding protein
MRLGSPRINLLPRAALPGLQAPERTASVGVRAEQARLHGPGHGPHASARVHRIELLSDQHLVHLKLEGSDADLVVAAPMGQRHEPGAAVGVEMLRPLWFDASGQRLAA